MNQYAIGKRDGWEKQILEVVERAGYVSFDKHIPFGTKGTYIKARPGQGCDFFLLGPFGVVLVEDKDGRKPPSQRKLTDDESKLAGICQVIGVPYVVVETPEEMAEVLEQLETVNKVVSC